jgi:hypothetical protein
VVCGFKLQLWCPLPHIDQAPEMVHNFFREMGRNHFPARLMTVNCAVFSSQVPKITGITLVVEPPAGHTGVRKTVLFSLQKYQQNWCQIGSTPLPGLLFIWVVSTCFKYVWVPTPSIRSWNHPTGHFLVGFVCLFATQLLENKSTISTGGKLLEELKKEEIWAPARGNGSCSSLGSGSLEVIWVWVKIRYPNNWMVNTKLD